MQRTLIVFGIAAALSASGLLAQEPTKVAGDVYKEKLTEKGVRVLEVTFKPGQKIAEHSHPDHVVYALTDGKISITEKGKEAQVKEIKAGDSMYLPAQTHTAQNMGDKELKLVVVELPPAK